MLFGISFTGLLRKRNYHPALGSRICILFIVILLRRRRHDDDIICARRFKCLMYAIAYLNRNRSQTYESNILLIYYKHCIEYIT